MLMLKCFYCCWPQKVFSFTIYFFISGSIYLLRVPHESFFSGETEVFNQSGVFKYNLLIYEIKIHLILFGLNYPKRVLIALLYKNKTLSTVHQPTLKEDFKT